jgi:hypothetical protein
VKHARALQIAECICHLRRTDDVAYVNYGIPYRP